MSFPYLHFIENALLDFVFTGPCSDWVAFHDTTLRDLELCSLCSPMCQNEMNQDEEVLGAAASKQRGCLRSERIPQLCGFNFPINCRSGLLGTASRSCLALESASHNLQHSVLKTDRAE